MQSSRYHTDSHSLRPIRKLQPKMKAKREEKNMHFKHVLSSKAGLGNVSGFSERSTEDYSNGVSALKEGCGLLSALPCMALTAGKAQTCSTCISLRKSYSSIVSI